MNQGNGMLNRFYDRLAESIQEGIERREEKVEEAQPTETPSFIEGELIGIKGLVFKIVKVKGQRLILDPVMVGDELPGGK